MPNKWVCLAIQFFMRCFFLFLCEFVMYYMKECGTCVSPSSKRKSNFACPIIIFCDVCDLFVNRLIYNTVYISECLISLCLSIIFISGTFLTRLNR